MPIQNVGTLLENLVVTEAAVVLLHFCRVHAAPLEFLNSFAMPPQSPWIPNPQNAGFDDSILDAVRDASDSAVPQAATYPYLLRANLRADRGQGPNAALLVAGASLLEGAPCRMWLNDIRSGHYGDAIPQLEQIEAEAASIYGIDAGDDPGLKVRVSDTEYPDSIADLAGVLQEWNRLGCAGARLGFLDPMRYRIGDRQRAETSSEDHRRWLAQLAFDRNTCAIHFTGHSDHASLEKELRSLHDDAVAQGYSASRTFKRQHYAVFVASRSLVFGQAERVAAEVQTRVCRAWDSWCEAFTSLRARQLRIYRDGIPI